MSARDPRLHVVHLVLSLEPGGLENGVVNVVNGLDPARFRSTVVCLRTRGAFAARIVAPAAHIVEAGVPAGRDWAAPLRLAGLLKRLAPDVLHTRNPEPFLLGAPAALIGGLGALVHSEHGRTFGDSRRRVLAQRWLSRRADRMFAVSARLRDDLAHHIGLDRDRIDVLYNGVDLTRFAVADPAARARARVRLGLAPDGFVVGSVGRLVPVKDYPSLLTAFATLPDPSARLVLIGDGPERAALDALARAPGLAGRVVLAGHRDDVADLLPGLDAFALPSISEGLSNTLLEAMACGLPAVVSAVGGNTEIVRDGQEGLVFASGDVPALSDALARLAGDPALRASMAARAAARARESFGIEAMVRRYERLYEEAAAARPARR